jgi:hypothetical protein
MFIQHYGNVSLRVAEVSEFEYDGHNRLLAARRPPYAGHEAMEGLPTFFCRSEWLSVISSTSSIRLALVENLLSAVP